jgi:hypothetical protein
MSGRRSIKGKARQIPKFERHGICYRDKLHIVQYLIECGSMAKTVQEFYGHLTKQQQVNKKAQIRKWRRDIEHIRAMVESGRGSVENERSVGVGTVLTKVAEEQIVLWVNTLRKDAIVYA